MRLKVVRGASSQQALRYFLIIVTTIAATRFALGPGCSGRDHSDAQWSPNARYKDLHGVFASKLWPERGYGSRLSLRIYVYEEAEVDGLKELLAGRDHNIAAGDCMKGQWGTQVKIHKLLLDSSFRTLNKREADLFFVPCYVKCVRMKGGLTDKEINAKYVQILKQMPYFRLSGGRDHIFVFPSGAGAHLFKQWPVYLNRSIFLTPEGDRTDKRNTSAFSTWKDIIIPGNVDNELPLTGSPIHQASRPIPLNKRTYLANFLGRAQHKEGRLRLLELAKQFPEELDVPLLDFSGSKLERKDYYKRLGKAKFCLAPRGESSWTLRFFESFFVECVPVIISDHIELPFQNVLDYRGFSIKWPASRIGEQLLQYLRSIPDAEIERMISRGREVRCLWIYGPPSPLACNAMTAILWELSGFASPAAGLVDLSAFGDSFFVEVC